MEKVVLWPAASERSPWWVLVPLLLLILIAVTLEVVRQVRVRRRALAASWRHVMEIAREKGLSEPEIKTLQSLIQRWSWRDPLRVVTVRQHFDQCVDAEMRSLSTKGSWEAFVKAGITLRDIRVHLALDYVPVAQAIHSTRDLHVGQSIFVSRALDTPPRWSRMSVMEINEACFSLASQEVEKDRQPEFTPGDEVRSRMWREDDARYAFTIPFDRFEEAPPLFVFSHTSELKRVQSRAHFRVRYDQTTTVGILNAPVHETEDAADVKRRAVVTRLRGRFTSLSAGGFALVIQQPVPQQVLLRVVLDLDAAGPFEVEGRIVGIAPLSGGRHLVRARYIGIEDTTRDKIARYVLYRQRNLLPAQEPEQP